MEDTRDLSGILATIDLYSRDGEYVSTVETLPFQIMPEGFLWGERFFTLDEHSGQYREVFMVAIVRPTIKRDGPSDPEKKWELPPHLTRDPERKIPVVPSPCPWCGGDTPTRLIGNVMEHLEGTFKYCPSRPPGK